MCSISRAISSSMRARCSRSVAFGSIVRPYTSRPGWAHGRRQERRLGEPGGVKLAGPFDRASADEITERVPPVVAADVDAR